MDALTQARSDADFAGRTENPEWQTKASLAAQAWALIALAERLDRLAVVLEKLPIDDCGLYVRDGDRV